MTSKNDYEAVRDTSDFLEYADLVFLAEILSLLLQEIDAIDTGLMKGLAREELPERLASILCSLAIRGDRNYNRLRMGALHQLVDQI